MPVDMSSLRANERPRLIFLEITDREVLGFNLHAPQRAEGGSNRYRLMTETQPGDTVLHYHRPSRGLVGISRVAAPKEASRILWAAKGTSARARHIRPYWRPSWKVPLKGYRALEGPLERAVIASKQKAVLRLKDQFEAKYGERSLFPYYRYSPTELRTQQAYLAFFPRSLFGLFPELGRQVASYDALSNVELPAVELDPPDPFLYLANENIDVDHPGTIKVDRAAVVAARREHSRLQNTLRSRALKAKKTLVKPPNDANVDLAWKGPRSKTTVAEVKSLSYANEVHQLRYGLGQLLDYLDEFAANGTKANGVLFVSRPPSKFSWLRKCEAMGVELCWPDNWPRGL